jgi:hypothetical protein
LALVDFNQIITILKFLTTISIYLLASFAWPFACASFASPFASPFSSPFSSPFASPFAFALLQPKAKVAFERLRAKVAILPLLLPLRLMQAKAKVAFDRLRAKVASTAKSKGATAKSKGAAAKSKGARAKAKVACERRTRKG